MVGYIQERLRVTGREEGIHMSIWSQLTNVPHADPAMRRRGRLLAIVLLAVTLLAALFIPVVLLGSSPALGIGMLVVSMAVYAGILRLAHLGYIAIGGWLFCLSMVAVLIVMLVTGRSFSVAFYLVLPINVAALVLPPAHIGRLLIVILIGVATALLLNPAPLLAESSQTTVAGSTVLIVGSAFLAYMGSRATQAALQAADANAARAEAAQLRAEAQARDLESHTEALSAAEERLRDLVATLETPAVAVADGVLLAPIVGAIDSRRAQVLTERLLASIAGERVKLLILDLAGVAMVDTAVTATLLQIAQAVRLLGCKVVLTGIAPAVAVTITSLGAGLEGIETARSPHEVLVARVAAGAVTIAAPAP
jgi:rsbT co-antagonist protein RsbR